MDWSTDTDESTGSDWDDFEARSATSSSSDTGKSNEASEAGPSNTNLKSHFIDMGFSEELVEAVSKQNGGDTEGMLETLLTCQAVGKLPDHDELGANCSFASGNNIQGDDSSDSSDSEDFGFEHSMDDLSEEDYMISTLVDMGFLAEEVSAAIERCGPNASITELTDSIQAAQMQEEFGHQLSDSSDYSDYEGCKHNSSKRKKIQSCESNKRKKTIQSTNKMKGKNINCEEYDDDVDPSFISKRMTGFSLPFGRSPVAERKLPESAVFPPFFYYENVAIAPKDVWPTMSRFLSDIEPEFVDSVHFCAAARKRGYIHNLPIRNRFPLLPIPPKTIHEAFPNTKKWWPPWDTRTHLNCIQTSHAPPKLTEKIRIILDQHGDPPPQTIQQKILHECRKWNLVWIGHHKVVHLEPDEIEMLLGFPRNHTRGISRSDRYKALGNSFQVDTVAFHLSVLRDMFPSGITVLSLFSGIGGAEVALHRLGIRLRAVVSVELSSTNRNILRSWWEQTGQTGTLTEICDVQELSADRIEHFIKIYGGFDLVIGGSPCNNLTGSNRTSRVGMEGKHSVLFYDYYRILELVKSMMGTN